MEVTSADLTESGPPLTRELCGRPGQFGGRRADGSLMVPRRRSSPTPAPTLLGPLEPHAARFCFLPQFLLPDSSSWAFLGESFSQIQQRLLRDKEVKIRRALERLRGKRHLLRRQRTKREFPVVSVVGYTNCGEIRSGNGSPWQALGWPGMCEAPASCPAHKSKQATPAIHAGGIVSFFRTQACQGGRPCVPPASTAPSMSSPLHAQYIRVQRDPSLSSMTPCFVSNMGGKDCPLKSRSKSEALRGF
jgi:hypothetical protein